MTTLSDLGSDNLSQSRETALQLNTLDAILLHNQSLLLLRHLYHNYARFEVIRNATVDDVGAIFLFSVRAMDMQVMSREDHETSTDITRVKEMAEQCEQWKEAR